MKRRLGVLLVGWLFLGLILVLRAFQIQLIGDSRLQQLAQRQFQSRVLIRPKRGAILDREGRALAVNLEVKSLAANPSKISNPRQTARELAHALGMPARDILAKLESDKSFVWIKRHLTDALAKRVELIEGLWLVQEQKRIYPQGAVAGPVLGTVNLDAEGIEGVELWKEADLAGKIISVRAIKDAMGRATFLDASAASELQDGKDIRLTLDFGLQVAVERELGQAVTHWNAHSGTAIVMNAASGEILAMASVPSFDPNARSAQAEHRRTRALTDGFEPGSTVKALLMASALEHGVRASDVVWGGMGQTVIQGHRIGEAEEHEKFAWLNLAKMVTVSSNVGAAKFALKLGAKNFLETLGSFEFGQRTGLGFPGEIPGWLPSLKKTGAIHLANLGFGQGLFVTPLQMTRAFAALANGGWLIQPKLLVQEQTAQAAQERAPVKVLSESSVQATIGALENVVQSEEGTGKLARLDGYRVVGKTATAQVVDPATRKYSRTNHIASFVGFPVGFDTKVVVPVVFVALNNPTPRYYAGEIAAPLFQRVLAATVHRLGIPARPLELAAKKPIRDATTLTQAHALSRAPRSPRTSHVGELPDLRGLSAREVAEMLSASGARVFTEGFGVVKEQNPAPGVTLKEGSRVWVKLGE